jgi:hypothetical protein
MADTAAVLEEILEEAQDLIRKRLETADLAVPYVLISVTPDERIVLCSNVSADVLRSFGDDLQNAADEIEARQGGWNTETKKAPRQPFGQRGGV